MALAAGTYALTGGLGGLGLRAAKMLTDGGVLGVVLSSRSGRVGGRAVDEDRSVVMRVAACDIGDAADALVVGFDDPADIALVVVPVGAECPALGAASAESEHERQGQEDKGGAAGEHDGILARMVTEARLGRLELGP